MDKLQKTARTLDTFFKITYWFTLILNIFAVLIIALFLFFCLSAPELFGNLTDSLIRTLDFGGISFRIAESFPHQSSYGTVYFFMGLTLGTLAVTLYVLMLRSIRRILAPMKEGLPFSTEVAAGFRNLGWLTTVLGILELTAVFSVDTPFKARAYDLHALFVGDGITAVTTYYNFDFTFILAALVLFGLSYIFHYGTELQQLSDETL